MLRGKGLLVMRWLQPIARVLCSDYSVRVARTLHGTRPFDSRHGLPSMSTNGWTRGQ